MRIGAEIGFGVIALLLIAAVVTMYPEESPTGMVVSEPEILKPYIELTAPDDGVTSYNPVQTFLFRVKSVDYASKCFLIVNDERTEPKALLPGHLGRFDIELDPGYYKWKIECQLLNKRTIASIENHLAVEPYQNRDKGFAVTGNVVKIPEKVTDPKGIIIALAALGALVWAFNMRKD